MSEYTPTTDEVRDAIRIYRVYPEEFDRWLASIKAEAVAESAQNKSLAVAWDEAAAFVLDHIHGEAADVSEFNPYREA